jgi:hypothetical protein
MAAGENLELACLELEHYRACYPDSLRDAVHTFSARRRIMGSISVKGTSCSKVSSAEIDLVGLSGTTWLSSIPRASS